MGIDRHISDATPHVVYAFDEGFRYCSVLSAFSVLKHRSAPTRISFVTGCELAGLADAVKALSKAFPQAKLEILVRPELNLDFETGIRVTAASYMRLALSQHFTGRILYLDGDTMARCDIAPLYNTDMQGKAFAAALDAVIERDLYYTDWWLRKTTKDALKPMLKVPHLFDFKRYVNSGVLLMDLKAAMANETAKTVFDIAAAVAFVDEHNLRFQDQDWLNHVATDQIHILAPEWNALWGNHRTNRPPLARARRKAYRNSRKNPGLVHYTTHKKPWQDHGFSISRPARRWDREYKALMAEMTTRLGVELRDSLL